MKLIIVIGIVLGQKGTMLTLLLASALGFFVSSILILFKKVNRKQSVPFGPYIIIAALVSYFHGESIMALYI